MYKPIVLYDTNIFSNAGIDDIAYLLKNTQCFLTYDVVLELIVAKNKLSKNQEYMEKMNLIFKDNNGLQDNVVLLLSHIPIFLGETYDNTTNILDLKNNPKICSAYHTWLRSITFPALLFDVNRHMNSELLWYMQQGSINIEDEYKIAEKIFEEVKRDETKKAEPYFQNGNIKAKKITNTWGKRKKDINAGKFKITDSRLIMQGFSILANCKQDVIILTGDYDLIDLLNNLLSVIINDYTIAQVLNNKCKMMNFEKNNIIELKIVFQELVDAYEEVIKKTQENSLGPRLIIWMYKNDDKKIYPFPQTFPNWLLDFALAFKKNLDCCGVNNKVFEQYPYKYQWESQPRGFALQDEVKFRVCKRKRQRIVDNCRMKCLYEFEEINCPEKLSDFSEKFLL